MKQISLKRFSRLAHLRHVPLLLACGLAVVVMIMASAMLLIRTAGALDVRYREHDQPINQPLSIDLGQNIRDIDLSAIQIKPQVDGSWQLQHGSVMATDRLVFTPSRNFIINTDYRITLPPVERYLIGDRRAPEVVFKTEPAPSLLPRELASRRDGDVIAADYVFTAEFSAPNNDLRQLVLRTTPDIPSQLDTTDDTVFRWRPETLLPQGSELTVELYDEKNQKSLLRRQLRVAPEPTVTSPERRDHIGERDDIVLTFASAIDPASERLISWSTPGTGSWRSPNEYVFRPQSLAPGQDYSYEIAPGLRSAEGGITTSPIRGSFATTGAVYVTAAGPRGSELAQGSQIVSFTFDQPVDRASAERRFGISSGTVQNFSWQGNTLQATVNDLGYQRTVTMRIEAGIINAGFGLPSRQVYTHNFTTEIRSVRLAVPHYRQQHSGTCSAASLRMALAYRGVGSDEMGLVHAMGYAPRDRDNSTNPPTWDDPMQMFVGSVDGSIIAGTGAGPDAPPIARAARAYGRNAQNFTDADAGWIAQQVYAGNPVLMFGSFRATGTTSWRTPSGGTAIMNLTGHVTVVIGVKGEPSNPIGFWVNDPLNGGTQYWSLGAVAANIARDPYRQAVVVY